MSDMPVWITVNGVDEEIPEECMDCVTTGILWKRIKALEARLDAVVKCQRYSMAHNIKDDGSETLSFEPDENGIFVDARDVIKAAQGEQK